MQLGLSGLSLKIKNFEDPMCAIIKKLFIVSHILYQNRFPNSQRAFWYHTHL